MINELFISCIATYHLQGLILQYYSDNGTVVVECRFAERSTADGCHVIFSGNYTVTAHDIVDGTIITNPSVVYPQILEFILLLPSPTETIFSSMHAST